MKRFLANLVDAALNRYAPIVHARTYAFLTDVKGADLLTDAEADIDTWEPRSEPLLPWEQELLDATTMTDEQWAAHYLNLPKDQTADDFVNNNPDLFDNDQPAGTVANPPTASGPGGLLNNDVAHVVAVVLRGQGINSAPIYADLIARELGHHFDITKKTTN